jgi:hypothetical protein
VRVFERIWLKFPKFFYSKWLHFWLIKTGVSRSSNLRCKFHEYLLKVNENSIFIHGSLEAILGRTKLSTKTKTGDGWGMVPGVPNKFHKNPICFFPPQSFQKFIFFSVCQLQGFFDEYFVLKSLSRLSKLLIESNKVSKTVLGSKIRALYVEILAFFQYKVRRD